MAKVTLIDHLGRFDPVVVRPTGAVHSYRNRADDPAAVGRTLQSDAVVDSSFDIPRYLAEMTEHAACAGVAPESLEPLLKAYAAGGQAGAFHRLEQLSGNLNVPAAVLALFAGMAGELETAFVQLDRAIGDRDPILMELAVGPQWDSLRGDPRFDECVARMGLRVRTE